VRISDYWERHRTAIAVTAVSVGLWLLLILDESTECALKDLA
jgi:hypothetical protein